MPAVGKVSPTAFLRTKSNVRVDSHAAVAGGTIREMKISRGGRRYFQGSPPCRRGGTNEK